MRRRVERLGDFARAVRGLRILKDMRGLEI